MRRVVITGMSGITALGTDWETEVKPRLLQKHNAVQIMADWKQFDGMHTNLAAPVTNFTLPEHYTRKKLRGMGRVSQFAVRSTELALQQAGLLDDPRIREGNCGVAYGSSTGSTDAVRDFLTLVEHKNMGNINATTYVRMMPHTTAVNTAIFFGLTGRIIPTSTACTSGSLAIGYAYEAIKNGYQDVMVAGGGEELCPSEAAVFDVLFATSCKNDTPKQTPAPFDKDRDGLVIGEGAATLILEELEHALARNAPILAEVIGFATNCDATHITQPNQATIQKCMELALKSADLNPEDIGYINAHGTATERGDIAESLATYNIFGDKPAVSTLKSYVGHTLGACGAIEAWWAIKMMNEGWFTPNLNLKQVDPRCGLLNFIKDDVLQLHTPYIMSNNFAFGGVNTSLIFKRWNAA